MNEVYDQLLVVDKPNVTVSQICRNNMSTSLTFRRATIAVCVVMSMLYGTELLAAFADLKC